jgi:hypothetical protein
LFDRAINVSAIIAAYLLTAATILPALDDKQTLKWLSVWGYRNFLVDYLQFAIYGCGALLLLSCAAAPLSQWLESFFRGDQAFSSVWWGLVVYSLLSMLRATNLLIKLLKAR